MTLIIETGAIVDNSDSYASIAESDVYAARIGLLDAAWIDLDQDTQKEPALRVAAQYLTTRWRTSWKGERVRPIDDTSGNIAQSLAWPRQYVYTPEGYLFSSTAIPLEVKQAQMEYAFIAVGKLDTGIQPAPTIDPSGHPITRYAVSVGSISEETDFSIKNTSQQILRPYPKADSMLAAWLKSSGGAIRG